MVCGCALVSISGGARPREPAARRTAARRGAGERGLQFHLKSTPMCGYTLFTDHPLQIAAGSMPRKMDLAWVALSCGPRTPGIGDSAGTLTRSGRPAARGVRVGT
jgi:hypothetical protein